MDKSTAIHKMLKPIFSIGLEMGAAYINRTLKDTDNYGKDGFWQDPIMREFHEATKKRVDQDVFIKTHFKNMGEIAFIILDSDPYYKKSFYLMLREWFEIYDKNKTEIDAWTDSHQKNDETRGVMNG